MEKDNSGPNRETLREKVRNHLGAAVGMRPTWFDQGSWVSRTPAERRMIRVMHDKGSAGFTVLRSAETGLKHYTRQRTNEET